MNRSTTKVFRAFEPEARDSTVPAMIVDLNFKFEISNLKVGFFRIFVLNFQFEISNLRSVCLQEAA